MKRAMPLCALVVVTAGAGLAHAEAPPDATALFEQGIKDMEGGHLDVACKEIAASLAKYDDSGTKGALAECYTKLGRVVSAWNLWRDLADTAPTQDLRKDAASNAFQLEAQLPHFVIRLKGAPAPGLAVIVADNQVADPTLAVPLPVDPGPFTVQASAPDYETWTHNYEASVGKTTTVEIPPLVLKPKPKQAAKPSDGSATVIVRDDIASTRQSRHLLGLSLGIAGGASLALGAFFGLQASSHWSDAKSACQDMPGSCPAGAVMQAQASVDSARTDALVSTIALTIGGVAVLGGVISYISAPKLSEDTRTALHVTPTASAHAAGITISGGW